MSFLTPSDISALIPSGADTNEVQLILDMLQEYLQGLGLTFTTTTNQTFQFYPKYNYQKEFRADNLKSPNTYFSTPTSVTKKSETDASISEALTIRKDYFLTSHHKNINANYIISLKDRSIAYPYYLEVVATTGFANSVDNTLKMAIIEVVKHGLILQKAVQGAYDTNGNDIASTGIKSINVSYVHNPRSYATRDKLRELFDGENGDMLIIKSYMQRL